MFAVLKEAGKMGEKICICLQNVRWESSCLVYFCLLPANLRGGRVVTGPLQVLLPAGNVVSGVYIVYALFEYKKWIFSVYIVYAFFLLSARWFACWGLRVAKNVRI